MGLFSAGDEWNIRNDLVFVGCDVLKEVDDLVYKVSQSKNLL